MADKPGLQEKLVGSIWAKALVICPDLMSPENAKVREEALLAAADQVVAEGSITRAEIDEYLVAVRRLLITEKFTEDFGMSEAQAGKAIRGAPGSPGARFERYN